MTYPTKTTAAVALAALVALSAIVPVSAQGMDRRDRYVQSYCDNHPRDRDCRDWRNNRQDWDDSRYQSWYRSHNDRSGDAVAAGIFGVIGGIVGAAAANGGGTSADGGGRDHIDRCEARYRSYDVRSDTFLSNDGNRYRCRL